MRGTATTLASPVMTHRTITSAVRRLPVPVRDSAYRLRGLARGEWPTAVADVVQPLLTRDPVTFNEKVKYRMAHDRRPILRTFADKLLAREFAMARIEPDFVLPLLAVGENADGIPWATLPREYACKVNHGSGGVIIVSDHADPGVELPRSPRHVGWRRYLVHPDQADARRMAALVDHWLAQPYRWRAGAAREWAYRDIARRVFVEEYCGGPAGLPLQMSVQCFDGEPRALFFFVPGPEVQRSSKQRFLMEERETAAARAGLTVAELDRVLDACRALAADVDMVRVDWNVGSRGPRFGELTNYPAAGHAEYSGHATIPADEFEALLSSLWRLP